MEQHSPVLFLDLNSDDLSTGMEILYLNFPPIFLNMKNAYLKLVIFVVFLSHLFYRCKCCKEIIILNVEILTKKVDM